MTDSLSETIKSEVESGALDSLPVPPPKRKTSFTFDELTDADFPEPNYIVPEMIPAGVTDLNAKSKVGKTTMTVQLTAAKASGGNFLGYKLDPGPVLYIAYEDGARNLKDRFTRYRLPRGTPIQIETEWRLLPKGGMADIQLEVARDYYGLIVIDPISYALGMADRLNFGVMYSIFGDLNRMAVNANMSIVCNDHQPKHNIFEANPLDDAYGAASIGGAVAAALGIYRDKGKKEWTLSIRGREIPERDLAIRFDRDTLSWQLLGELDHVQQDSRKGKILKAIQTLKTVGTTPTVTAIAEHTGIAKSHVSTDLADLIGEGKVTQLPKDGRQLPFDLL